LEDDGFELDDPPDLVDLPPPPPLLVDLALPPPPLLVDLPPPPDLVDLLFPPPDFDEAPPFPFRQTREFLFLAQ